MGSNIESITLIVEHFDLKKHRGKWPVFQVAGNRARKVHSTGRANMRHY